jgi:hypothetical protein
MRVNLITCMFTSTCIIVVFPLDGAACCIAAVLEHVQEVIIWGAHNTADMALTSGHVC